MVNKFELHVQFQMYSRTFKIIMAVLTFAIILAVFAVCFCIPVQQPTTQGTTGNKGVERDVSSDFITLQHIDDSHGKGPVVTTVINDKLQESDDYFSYKEINAEDIIDMLKSGDTRPGNLAMLKAVKSTHTPTNAGVSKTAKSTHSPANAGVAKTAKSAHTPTNAGVTKSAMFTERSYPQVGSTRFTSRPYSQHAKTDVVMSTARPYPRADVFTEVNDVEDESSPRTEIKTTHIVSSEAGSNNVVDEKSPSPNEIVMDMPGNLAEDVKSNLASIANSLDSMVQLLKGMQQKTDKMFDNMTATMKGLFESLPSLLSATPEPSPRDCTDIAAQGYNESSTYIINPDGTQSYRVYCDLDSEGGGWTVFQRRFDGSVDFYHDWPDYVDGFGKAFGEYWAGLELIHRLTKTGTWELLIHLEDFDGYLAFAHYASFRVGGATSNYRLYIGAYDGTAGDAMTEDNHNKEFSTFDHDNDERSWGNCAQYRKGAWWFGSCSAANLNGLYLGPKKVSDTGMYWRKWKNSYEVLKRSEMKMRRIL